MKMNEIAGRLDLIGLAVRAEVEASWPDQRSAYEGRFTVARWRRWDEDHEWSGFEVNAAFQAEGLAIKLGTDFTELNGGWPGRAARLSQRFVAAVRQIARDAAEIKKRHGALITAAKSAVNRARADGAAMSLVSVVPQRVYLRVDSPIDEGIRVQFAVTTVELDTYGEPTVYTATLSDVTGFEKYFERIALPQQLRRAAKVAETNSEKAQA